MQDWVFRLGSEGLILASTNSQQYDKRLFIELRVQYMLCTQIVLNFETKNQFVYTPSTELSVVILWVSRCKNKCFWHGFTSKLKSIRTDQSKRHISWGKKIRFRRFRIRKNMQWTRYRSETKRKPYSSAYTTKYSQRTPPKDLKEMVTKVKDEENESVHALVRSPPVAVPTPPSQVSSPFKIISKSVF